jgi:hypothetical protein
LKVLFAGPSLFGLIEDGAMAGFPGIDCRPPAGQGDIVRAVLDGATSIGLVDGRYEDQPAPWHKEILWAIQNGVTVLGGASLGALRAVECAPFGMIGVGEVFRRYASGELIDDSDVAQLHGPAELGSMPLTEAFVNVEATILRAHSRGKLAAQDSEMLVALAREIFFKELTLEAVAARAKADPAASRDLLNALRESHVDQKREDALALVDRLAGLPDKRSTLRPDWTLATPAVWLNFLASLGAERENGRL